MIDISDPNRPSIEGGPAVILVEPQLGENIGTAARAMLNCGLTDLRLVRPRDGWPNSRAAAAASGADKVLEQARLYPTAAEAVADLTRVYATTARNRGMTQAILTPRAAAVEMRAAWNEGGKVGILFGPERTGLFNDDLTLADALVSVPVNPSFASLNLAQCVLILGYEWFQTGADLPPDRHLAMPQSGPATKAALVNLFEHLEQELDAGNFWSNPEKRPSMVRNIRNAFERMGLTEQEVRTFHGIIACLAGRSKRRPPSQG
ncbi:MAG TPA: RNA methyltransferase [Azospirillaceae bacterium]|nr:RNA methyltransferase [Azospirillaceae bacterium]